MLGIAKWRGFGIDFMHSLADVCVVEDSYSFGIRGHEAVFDAIVHHLNEVPCPALATVQVALLGRAADFLAAWRARNVARSGRERGKGWIKMLHDVRLAA